MDESDRQRVERRLAEDAAYREQLIQLQRTWDMLDSLPPATVNPSFTHSTVEMVALSAKDDVSNAGNPLLSRKTLMGLGGSLLALLAAIVTYTVAADWLERPHRQLVADLPVIENIDAYRYLVDGDSIRFLQRLDAENLFNTTGEDGESTLVFTSVARQVIDDTASVPEEDKLDLRRKKVRFDERSPTDQDQLRRIHAQLDEQPDAARLRAVLAHYNDWMSALPSTQRTALLALPEEERFEETRRLLEAEEDKRFSAYVRARLSPEDQKRIDEWLRMTVARERGALLEKIPSEFRRDWNRLREEDQTQRLFWHIVHPVQLAAFLAALQEPDVAALVESLSPEARRAFRQQESAEKRNEILMEWVRASVWGKFRPTFEQMKEYLAEHASPKDREYLENLPREQMYREMGEMYMKYRRPRGGRPPFGRGSEGRGPDIRGLESRGPDGRPGDERRPGDDRRGADDRRERDATGPAAGERFEGPPGESRFDRRRGNDSRTQGPRPGESPPGGSRPPQD